MSKGVIVGVAGVVVDVEFPDGDLPSIHNALVIQRDEGSELVVEVHEHINPLTVRTMAMGGTAGLRRGLSALDTQQPIQVPVGQACLGRMFNVLGEPIDHREGPEAPRRAIHVESPSMREQRAVGVPGVKQHVVDAWRGGA